MFNLSYSDLGIFIVFTFISFYALDALDYQKILKSSKVFNARVLHALITLALSALVFLYYLFLKLTLNGII